MVTNIELEFFNYDYGKGNINSQWASDVICR